VTRIKDKEKRVFALIWFVIFSLVLAACGGSAGEGDGTGGVIASEEDTSEDRGSSGGSGLCANEYLPVVEGATWTYEGTDEALGTYTFISTLKDVHPEGFTYFNDFDELAQQQKWSCTAEGLLALEYNRGAAATISIAGVESNYVSTDISGVSLPREISIGDTWEHGLTLSGTQSMPDGTIATTAAVVSFSFEAIGEEGISVVAGDFEALKVRAVVVFDLEISVNDVVIPTTLVTESFVWWVQRVGWVKSEDRVEMAGVVSVSSIELQSYSIP